MDSEFYRAFEDRFRGPRDIIKSRFRVYLPFIEPLNDAYPDVQIVDLGCGRGEWLELLSENGFSGLGIDIDEEMLSLCRELDLQVQTNDALSYLKNVPDESLAAITAFHLVEHIPFDDLQVLVEESLRVLKPAGLLILETPNPENLVVGTSSFYLDPTHKRPIPPELLTFIPEYYGFGKVKILRLQEPTELASSDKLSLLNVLNGVSPDYGVVAQKSTDDEQFELSREPFDTEYGVTLEQLAESYSLQNENTMTQNEWLKNELDAAKIDRENLVSKHAASRTDARHLRAQLSETREAVARSDAALHEQHVRSQDLQNDLNVARTQREELAVELATTEAEVKRLTKELGEKSQALGFDESALVEHQVESKWMQNEIDAARARQEELASELATTKAEVKYLNKEISDKSQLMEDDKAALVEQQVESQQKWHGVLNAARARQEELAGELAITLDEVEHLKEELSKRLSEESNLVQHYEAALTGRQAELQVLQIENETNKNQIHELLQSNHHWWLEADRLTKELHAISGSNSWRFTWPLRKLMQFFKWLIALPSRLVVWLVHLPVLAGGFLVAKDKVHTATSELAQPMPESIETSQNSSPEVTTEQPILTSLVAQTEAKSNDMNEGFGGDVTSEQVEDLSNLTPGARRTYEELKKARKETQGTS